MGLRRFFGPKNRVDSEFVHFVDENDEVMREHLTKRFVDNSNVRLATQAVPKLAFHHAERGFNIGPLVVVLQRVIPPALKVVVHLRPRSAAIPAMARGKGDIRSRAKFRNRIGVCPRSVTFVRRDFRNLKVFRRGCYQSGQHFGIARVPTMDFNGGHDIGFHPAHDVALNPIMLLLDDSILMVKPASEVAGGKAGRVYGKIRFHGFQKQTALGTPPNRPAIRFHRTQ